MSWLLRKELLLLWRGRSSIVAVIVFGATALLLFSFGIGPNAEALRRHAAGFLWLAILLASTLSLAESFHEEMQNRALEGMFILPVDARAIYFAKTIANIIQLLIVSIGLLPVMIVLYNVTPTSPARLFLILILGVIGLSAPGTLYAAMSAQVRAKQMLLPLLLFPLIVPALLASVRATSVLFSGDPMRQFGSWTMLLVAFDAIYLALSGLLFERVVED